MHANRESFEDRKAQREAEISDLEDARPEYLEPRQSSIKPSKSPAVTYGQLHPISRSETGMDSSDCQKSADVYDRQVVKLV